MQPDGHCPGVTGQIGQHGAAVSSFRQTRPSSGQVPSMVHSCGSSSSSHAAVANTATTSVFGIDNRRRARTMRSILDQNCRTRRDWIVWEVLASPVLMPSVMSSVNPNELPWPSGAGWLSAANGNSTPYEKPM